MVKLFRYTALFLLGIYQLSNVNAQDIYKDIYKELHLDKPLVADSMIVFTKNLSPKVLDTLWVDKRPINFNKVLDLIDSLLYLDFNSQFIVNRLECLLILIDSRYLTQYGFIEQRPTYSPKISSFQRRNPNSTISYHVKKQYELIDVIDRLEYAIKLLKLEEKGLDLITSMAIDYNAYRAHNPQNISYSGYRSVDVSYLHEYIRTKMDSTHQLIKEFTLQNKLTNQNAISILSIYLDYPVSGKFCSELSEVIELDKDGAIMKAILKSRNYFIQQDCTKELIINYEFK